MTLIADRLTRTAVGFNPLDRAVSPDARVLRRVSQAAAGDNNSITIAHQRDEVVRALLLALGEAVEENWDGYGAAAVNPRAVSLALRFLSMLPPEISMPEIAVDSYGDIALDWDYAPRRITSVRISADGTLYYASLLGHSTMHGSEVFSEMIPRSVMGAIKRVVAPSYR